MVADFSDLPVDWPLTPVDRLCLRKIFDFFLCYRSTAGIGPVDRFRCRTLCFFSVDRSLNPSRPIVVFWHIFDLFPTVSHSLSHFLSQRPKEPLFFKISFYKSVHLITNSFKTHFNLLISNSDLQSQADPSVRFSEFLDFKLGFQFFSKVKISNFSLVLPF